MISGSKKMNRKNASKPAVAAAVLMIFAICFAAVIAGAGDGSFVSPEKASGAVKLNTPKNVKAKTVITGRKKAKVNLTWSKVSGAAKYGVYVSSKASSGYKLKKYVKKASFSSRFKKTKNLYFKVCAVKGTVTSPLSIYAAIRPGIKGYNTTKIKLNWITTRFTDGKNGSAKGSANGKIASKLGVRFISMDPGVVRIVKTGKTSCKLESVKPGTAKVYMVAPNGMSICKKVRVAEKQVMPDTSIPNLIGKNFDEESQRVVDMGLGWQCRPLHFSREEFEKEYPGIEYDAPGVIVGQYLDGERTKVAEPGTIVPFGTKLYITAAVIDPE